MTMLGRGKRSDSEKNANSEKNAKDKATKAEEAAEAARLAEEAAAKAREAARLAQLAAEEAAAEAEESDEQPEETEKAAKSLQKSQDDLKGSEDTPDGDNPSEEDSAPPEVASATADEAADEATDEPKATRTTRTTKTTRFEPRGRFRSGSLTMVIAVLAVLAIAFGTGTTVLALKVREQNATETASKEASFAASRAAQKLSSYDFQTLDADLKSASATTTGKLRTDYDKLAQQLRTVAVQQQAVSTTTVMKVGVVDATPDKVVALVYANRSSATKADKQQRLPEPLRIRLTMVKKDGKWLASELTVIS
ncbi:hypothetical protein [Actinomadura sp. 9N215]|uniref:hypothetical protein n=1 Tax=Actinomadura sp. 9N215 TaxID=3375150 RepID=UPI0037AEE0A7